MVLRQRERGAEPRDSLLECGERSVGITRLSSQRGCVQIKVTRYSRISWWEEPIDFAVFVIKVDYGRR
jgi:hypothetical protein